jgi:hypothetical protein
MNKYVNMINTQINIPNPNISSRNNIRKTNTNINNRSSEFLRKTSATNGFDEYSSSDNNRISQKN